MKNFFKKTAGRVTSYAICTVSVILTVLSIIGSAIFISEGFYTSSKQQIIKEAQYNEFYNDAYSLIYYTVSRDKYDRFEINIHYSEEATNIRYRVISPDGEIIQSNTKEENFEYAFLYKVTDNGDYYNHYLLGVNAVTNEENVYRVELFLEEGLPVKDKYSTLTNFYSVAYFMRYWIFIIGIASFALFIWGLVMLILAAARKPETDELYLNSVNRLPFDGLLLILVAAFFGAGYLSAELLWNHSLFSEVILPIAFAFLLFLSLLLITESIAARIKTGTLIKNNLVYKLLRFVFRAIRRLFAFFRELISGIPLIWKTVLLIIFVSAFDLIMIAAGVNAIETSIILWIIKGLTLAPLVMFVSLNMRKLQRAGKEIAEGNLKYKVITNEMLPDFKRHGENLNSISEGLEASLQERLRSERTKTELITNVSHDIKTPLTSIINYASLISESEPLSDKQRDYAEILVKKSEQLKRLLGDLVEVSKATTGNLEVSLERCEAGVLLSQIAGEYNEQMEKAGLELITSTPEEGLKFMADSRRIWRVFENLMNNASKYSLPGSRVYLIAEEKGREVLFVIKNTSKTPLNVLPEELKERFVRGEASRTTEGSGLGLSIAESLTELQGGKMEIKIDGDLFKVTLSFPKAT